MKTAAQIAVDEWNEKGGVIGKQIKLVDYDDANSSEQAASVAEKIVGDPSICAVMGHFSSGVAMTAAEVYQEAGIALVNGSAAHMDYAKIGDCIFRNNAIYTTDANTMLQIMEWLGVKKFGILNPNTDAGVSVTSAVEDMMERYGDKYTSSSWSPASMKTAPWTSPPPSLGSRSRALRPSTPPALTPPPPPSSSSIAPRIPT